VPDYQADADAWWGAARHRAQLQLTRRWLDDEMSDDDLSRNAKAVKGYGWVPERPQRPKLARIWDIVTYWEPQGVFPILIGEPACFACEIRVPLPPENEWGNQKRWDRASRWLERGHLVNRCRDGLDGVQNLVPLCHRCNKLMPIFGDGPSAIAWVLRGGWVAEFAERLKQEPDHILARRVIGQALGA
jgi:hypothetical protein